MEAPTENYKSVHSALVKRIEEIDDDKLPIKKERILRLEKILSEKDETGVFGEK